MIYNDNYIFYEWLIGHKYKNNNNIWYKYKKILIFIINVINSSSKYLFKIINEAFRLVTI